jgi:RNA polymerase sigma-70 factor (sigma-E family)
VEFEQFVRERQRPLFRFAVVLCGDPVLAQDLLQNVLGRSYERWELVGAADDANAYVRRMLVNEFVGWRRLLHRTRPVAEFYDADLPYAPDFADSHVDRAALAGELRVLPARQRAVLVLRFYAGMSFAEIASCMECRESTARSYAARALATLRVQMMVTKENLDA